MQPAFGQVLAGFDVYEKDEVAFFEHLMHLIISGKKKSKILLADV